MIDLARTLLPFIAPLPILFFLLLCGWVLILFKKRKLSLFFIGLALVILVLSGYGIPAREQLYRLERTYSPVVLDAFTPDLKRKIRYVVVLGSGHTSDPALPVTAQIGGDSLYRLAEGLRILRQLPGSRLIISGGAIPGDPVPNAAVVAQVAREIGVSSNDILVEPRPRDTRMEAETLKSRLGTAPFVLVTSASHMGRAVGIFQDLGTYPIPAPTDYMAKRRPGWSAASCVPNCGNIEISRKIFYEWLGGLWNRWKSVSENSRS